MAPPKYKLLYFDIEGKAEPIRLAFKYAGVELEDYRFKERAEFIALKESGRFMFGQVPALQVDDDIVLNQTNAILRFVAQLAPASNLYSSDPITAARIDAICDQEADAFASSRVAKYHNRFGFAFFEDNKELLEKVWLTINEEVLPRHLNLVSALLKKGSTGWIAGTQKPSIADFCWAPILKSVLEGKTTGDSTVLKSFPEVIAFMRKFYALPAVAQYYADRGEDVVLDL